MFNSGIVEVIIGMVLVYLLLSLIASGINEIIASLLRWRARDLEEALAEILDKGLVIEFYKHGLVQSLTIRHSLWEKIQHAFSRSDESAHRRPSYIPSHMFALALLDVIPTYVKGVPTDELTDEMKAAQAKIAALAASIGSLAPPPPSPGTSGSISTPAVAASDALLGDLRTMIESARPFLPGSLYQSLSTLVNDKTVNNVQGAITKIENWFDDMMQRVSSLYKAKVQHFLLAIGLVLSVAVNADTLMLGTILWRMGPEREALVASAEAIARDNVLLVANPGNGDNVGGRPVLSGTLGTSGLELVRQVVSETRALRLPLGWNQNPADKEKDLTGLPGDFSAWLLKVLGLLVTTISISLGAPFWFDLLGKVVNIRSALKPPSKASSPPQPSTDQ